MLFDRWMNMGRIAATVGLYVTATTLDLDRVRYLGVNPLFGLSAGIVLLAPYWLWFEGAAGVARRRLVRETAPETFMFQGYPLLKIGLALLFVLFLLPPGLIAGQAGSGSALRAVGSSIGVMLAGGGLLLLAIFVPVFLRKSPLSTRDPLPTPSEEPEALRTALREQTERVIRERQDPAANPELAAKLVAAAAGSGFVRAALALEPDQQAAIGITLRLSAAQLTNGIRWQIGATCGTAGVMVVIGVWQWLRPDSGLSSLLSLAACGLFWGIGNLLAGRGSRLGFQREQEVDLKVARAMEDPRRYLGALRKLAEAERVTSVVVAGKRSLAPGFAQRCEHLERQLHLD